MHRHMSAVISPSGSILGIGYNHYPNNGWNSVHAEIHSVTNTINNIIRKEGRTRLVKSPLSVNIIVVRSNGSNSRPCHNCIHQLAENPYINVQKVYYSMINESGVSGLAVETMGTLLSNSDVHVSRGNMECIFEDEDEPVKPEQHSIQVHTVLSNREFVNLFFYNQYINISNMNLKKMQIQTQKAKRGGGKMPKRRSSHKKNGRYSRPSKSSVTRMNTSSDDPIVIEEVNETGLLEPATQPINNINDKFLPVPHADGPFNGEKGNWSAYNSLDEPIPGLITTLHPVQKLNNVAYVANTEPTRKLYEDIFGVEGRRRFINNNLFGDVFNFLLIDKIIESSKAAKVNPAIGRTYTRVQLAFVEQTNIALEFITQFSRYLNIDEDRVNNRFSFTIPGDNGDFLYYEVGSRVLDRQNVTFNKVVLVDFNNIAYRLAAYLGNDHASHENKISDGLIFMNKICSNFPDILFFVVANTQSKLGVSQLITFAPTGNTTLPNWIHINLNLKTKIVPANALYKTMIEIFGFSEADDLVLLGLYNYFKNTIGVGIKAIDVGVFSFDRYRFYTDHYQPVVYFHPVVKDNTHLIFYTRPDKDTFTKLITP